MIEAKLGDDPLIVNIDHGEAWSLNDKSPEPTVKGATVDEGGPARVNERRRLDVLQTAATRLIADELRAAGLYEQAATRGPARGGYDPARLKILLGPDADFTTGIHELIHFYVDYYTKQVQLGTATPQMRADLDIMFRSMGVAGDTPEARLAAFNAMPFETARPLVEVITYNAEIYVFEGKAPSVELAGVFDRMLQFFRRAYKSLADFVTQQQEIYRREFGRELPGLNDELRAVFDRMLADERQIKQAQAVSQMRGQFTVKPEGMDDAEWAAYQEMAGEATNEAIRDMTKASLRQMEWLSRARNRIIKEMQARHATQRKEVRERVQAEVHQERLYRAMSFLRRGQVVAPDGTVTKAEGVHRIDRVLAAEFAPTVDMSASAGKASVETRHDAGAPPPKTSDAARNSGPAGPPLLRPRISLRSNTLGGLVEFRHDQTRRAVARAFLRATLCVPASLPDSLRVSLVLLVQRFGGPSGHTIRHHPLHKLVHGTWRGSRGGWPVGVLIEESKSIRRFAVHLPP